MDYHFVKGSLGYIFPYEDLLLLWKSNAHNLLFVEDEGLAIKN